MNILLYLKVVEVFEESGSAKLAHYFREKLHVSNWWSEAGSKCPIDLNLRVSECLQRRFG